jgi:hypothetical protein
LALVEISPAAPARAISNRFLSEPENIASRGDAVIRRKVCSSSPDESLTPAMTSGNASPSLPIRSIDQPTPATDGK